MKTWWLVAAAAALVAVWWLRRSKAALSGTANTTGAAKGATAAGVLAVLSADKKPTRTVEGLLSRKVTLPPVGLGTVAPDLGTVTANKPAPPPPVQPPPKIVAGGWGWGSSWSQG